MGCILSKCCPCCFGDKTGEFDPDHHIMIEARDSRSFDDDILVMHRTSIENQNAVAVDVDVINPEARMTSSMSTSAVTKPLNRRLNSDMTMDPTSPMSTSVQSTETSPTTSASTRTKMVQNLLKKAQSCEIKEHKSMTPPEADSIKN